MVQTIFVRSVDDHQRPGIFVGDGAHDRQLVGGHPLPRPGFKKAVADATSGLCLSAEHMRPTPAGVETVAAYMETDEAKAIVACLDQLGGDQRDAFASERRNTRARYRRGCRASRQ